MKKTIKLLLVALFMLIAISAFSKVEAASASISASKTNATVGDNVTIIVSYNAAAWNLSVSGSGISSTKYVGNTDDAENASYSKSLSLNTSSTGTYTIYLTGDVSDGSTGVTSPVSQSVTVTVKPSSGGGSSGSGSSGTSTTKPSTSNKPSTSTTTEEKPKSTDNTLSSLTVTEGAITPEFNKDVREYNVTVPNEITNVNVVATPTDSKATTAVTGNTDLKEGENTVTVVVTAEDGSTSQYLIRVTRNRPELSLTTLVIKYKNQEGQLIEVPLNPLFAFNIYEYSLEDLEYWVEKLEIEAISNIEGAKIEIQGNEGLKAGENVITITLKLPITMEGEIATEDALKDSEEIKTYTIKFNKKEEPTLLAKISNWFKGIFGGVSVWYNDNQEKVVLGALGVCVIALVGLSVYIVVDYKKYKKLVQKLKKLNELEQNTPVSENIIESISQERLQEKEISNKDTENNKKNDRPKGGRHF